MDAAIEQLEHDDGRVELKPGLTLDDRALYSEDFAPTRIEKRNWTTYNYAALWISMAHCIPTYSLAAGLITTGMNWWQALLTIFLGNTIVLAPILLNSHPGTKYGIPFPVFARAAYGTVGSNMPAIMRAVVGCGWFGINAWFGGQATQPLLAPLCPAGPTLLGGRLPAPAGGHALWSWAGRVADGHAEGVLPSELVSFALFWALNILIVFKGMDLLRRVENWAAPFVL